MNNFGNYSPVGNQDDNSDIRNPLLDNSRDNADQPPPVIVQRELFEKEPRIIKKRHPLEALYAFLMEGVPVLTAGLIATLSVEQLAKLFSYAAVLKPLAETTRTSAEAYYMGKGETGTTLDDDVMLQTANILLKEGYNAVVKMFGKQMTRTDATMISLLLLTGIAAPAVYFWLVKRHIGEQNNLWHPISEEDKIAEIARRTDIENQRPVQQYTGSYPDQLDPKDDDLSDWLFKSLPKYLEPVAYTAIIPLYTLLSLSLYMSSHAAEYFLSNSQTEYDDQKGLNSTAHCGTDPAWLDGRNATDLANVCYKDAYVIGGNYGLVKGLEAYSPSSQAITWTISLAVLAGVIGATLLSKPAENMTLSPVYGRLTAAAGNQWPYILLALSALTFLPTGYTIFPGKDLYDGEYKLTYPYAVGAYPDLELPVDSAKSYSTAAAQGFLNAFMSGDAHALQQAKDSYSGDFFDGSPTTWTLGFTAMFMVLGAADFIERAVHIYKLACAGVIDTNFPMTAQEQRAYAAKYPGQMKYAKTNGIEPFLYGYLNKGLINQDLLKEPSYLMYQKIHNFTHNRFFGHDSVIPSWAELYPAVAIGVLSTLTVGTILSIMSNIDLLKSFRHYFDISYNILAEYNDCKNVDKTWCDASATVDGVNNSSRDYMNNISGDTQKALLLGAMALAGAPLGLVGIGIAFILVGQWITASIQYCAQHMPASNDNRSSETGVPARSRSDEGGSVHSVVDGNLRHSDSSSSAHSDGSDRETIVIIKPALSGHHAGLHTTPRSSRSNSGEPFIDPVLRTPSPTGSAHSV